MPLTPIPAAPGKSDAYVKFIAESAWRLLAMQDRDPASPTLGCFHYAFWRDKVSEFPDARYQEAGATLGLLSLPAFDTFREQQVLPAKEQLYDGFAAGIAALKRQQYPEGCFDEWYFGERGFAATEFPMTAYGLAAILMDNALQDNERRRLKEIFTAAGRWLMARDDFVKTNHEAAAAAALALAWQFTGEERFLAAATEKKEIVLSRQTPDGWFPEIGQLDLGYCSVLMDYMMIYSKVTGDAGCIPAMKKLTAFLLPHIRPDMTVSETGGICLNPYLGVIGFRLLAVDDDNAAAICGAMTEASDVRPGLSGFLADDLRLCRWSHLPLAASLIGGPPKNPVKLHERFPQGWTHHRGSAVYHKSDLHIYFYPCGGGQLSAYIGNNRIIEDNCPQIEHAGKTYASRGFDSERPVQAIENGFRAQLTLAPAQFISPGFLLRTGLRFACFSAWSSKLARQAIDWYRVRNRTALNQSAAPTAGGHGAIRFCRTVKITETCLHISDRFESDADVLAANNPIPVVHVSGQRIKQVQTLSETDPGQPGALVLETIWKLSTTEIEVNRRHEVASNPRPESMGANQ